MKSSRRCKIAPNQRELDLGVVCAVPSLGVVVGNKEVNKIISLTSQLVEESRNHRREVFGRIVSLARHLY